MSPPDTTGSPHRRPTRTLPVTLYFIRHGQTDWNAELRLQGQRDIPLNAKGRAQATRNGGVLAELLAMEPVDGDTTGNETTGAEASSASASLDVRFDFVSSPLSRTSETMSRARAAMGLAPDRFRTDARLAEICFGDWEGRTWPELRANEPDAVAERNRDPFHFRPPGDAETYADVTARLVAFLETLTRDTVIVSHGGVSRVLRGHLLGLPHDEITELKVPQDKVMRVAGGTIAWF